MRRRIVAKESDAMKIFVWEQRRNDLLRPRLSMKMMDYDLVVQDVIVQQVDDPSGKKEIMQRNYIISCC